MCVAVIVLVAALPSGSGGTRTSLLAQQVPAWKPLSELAGAERRQRQQLGAAAAAIGFTQPGYDNKNPKGLWGQGVPPEFRDQDFELIKALSDVEQDIDMSQADMDSIERELPHHKKRPTQQSWWPLAAQPEQQMMPMPQVAPRMTHAAPKTDAAPQQPQSWWPARTGTRAGYMGQRSLKQGMGGKREGKRQSLQDFGIPWASPVTQGYPGAEVLGGPYVPTEFTSDVLETENKKKLSTEGRWPYVKYYGQPSDGNDLDIRFYDYNDGYGGSLYDTLPSSYGDWLDE